MNARFWVYHHGWVKLTLKPGQKLNHHTAAPTEEGYSSNFETYYYDGKQIFSDVAQFGRDCDGPFESIRTFFCYNTSLKAIPSEVIDGEVLPDRPEWRTLCSTQRDYFAEEMGY